MGAGFGRTVKEIEVKLHDRPEVVLISTYEADESSEEIFKGVVDIVAHRVFPWGNTGGDGHNMEVYDYN